jgi:hypothetical protein
MSFLEFLQALGIDIPTPAYIAGRVLFGLVGIAAWRHGRKTKRPTAKWLGLALMLYPYATPQTWLLYAVGTALCAWLFFAWSSPVSG